MDFCFDALAESRRIKLFFFPSIYIISILGIKNLFSTTDFDFADKAVCFSGESLLQSSSSESQSPGLSGSSNRVGGVSKSSKVASAQSEYENDFPDNQVTNDLYGASRNNPCQTSNGDCISNILDRKHVNQLDNEPPLSDSLLSNGKVKDPVEECQTASHREKRFRKPTQRYIEEFSNLKSKEKVLSAAAKNKHLSVTSHRELHHIRLKALRKISVNNFDDGTSVVAPPEQQFHKGHLKNKVLISTCVMCLSC